MPFPWPFRFSVETKQLWVFCCLILRAVDYTLIKRKNYTSWPPSCPHAEVASELWDQVVYIPESPSTPRCDRVWQIPGVPDSKKGCHSWQVCFKHFDKSAYSKKFMFCWQGLFCCKIRNGQEQDLNLEGYCFHVSRADLLFTQGIFFSSLCRWKTCALLLVADMLSQMGSCFGTCRPSGLKICCIYDMDSYLSSQRTSALVLPFIAILTDERADNSPDWGDLPRSKQPVVQDSKQILLRFQNYTSKLAPLCQVIM